MQNAGLDGTQAGIKIAGRNINNLKYADDTTLMAESEEKPQFKSINSSVLSFLYGPTLTSIHDYWKNHSFDYMNHCLGLSQLFFQGASVF